ncbi:MAG: phosphoribosylanthranilate isomerase [Bacteroidota bacterium]
MLKLKVCGMKYPDNIRQLVKLQPDFIGFIFYDKSKRFVDNDLDISCLSIPESIKKTGVFVNSSINDVTEKVKKYKLDLVQLHGNESPEFCMELKNSGIKITKAFQMDEDFYFDILSDYESVCDYFLFDTKTKQYGGSGNKFDWQLLEKYNNEKPFFLSGGIDLDDVEEIKKLKELNIYAIDINSKFEIRPAEKDINKIMTFMKALRNID